MDHHTGTSSSSTECTVHPESFKSLSTLYQTPPGRALAWPWVFVLPDWIETWWKTFGAGYDPLLLSVERRDQVLGVAPLKRQGSVVSFAGSADICDYFDFVTAKDQEGPFFEALLNHLSSLGVKELDLGCSRPGSLVDTVLVPLARSRGLTVHQEPDGVSFEVDLPETWEGYLEGLASKQRHEVRRKLRRLEEAGTVRFEVHGDLHRQPERMEAFFSLFSESREDKKAFMTPRMGSFFKDMIENLSEAEILKAGVLFLNDRLGAVVLFFDFNNGYYLYNNGYDTALNPLSIGLLSKVLAIRHAISEKRTTFDFMKGGEIYKSRLGGREIALSRYRIRWA